MMREFKSVHDAHCCKVHGCKYGHDTFGAGCPVVAGDEQGIVCEMCEQDEAEFVSMKELIRRYLKDNLQITVRTSKAGYGGHCNALDVEVSLSLDGEEISKSSFEVVEGDPKGYY